MFKCPDSNWKVAFPFSRISFWLDACKLFCWLKLLCQVFLDEVNTSSCLGLFKEIIVDRTLDGDVSSHHVIRLQYCIALCSSTPPCSQHLYIAIWILDVHIANLLFSLQPIPDNVFIVAACNPHRGDSLASHIQKETWVRGTYYVRQLHPTLHFLMWDYGSLDEDQEREYINSKIKMLNRQMPNVEVRVCVSKCKGYMGCTACVDILFHI